VSRAASPLSAPVGAVHTSGRYVTTKTGRGCGYCGPPRPEGGTSLGVAALPCVRPGGTRQCSLIPAEYFKGRGFHWMRIRDDMRARQRESSALPPATWCSHGWGSLGRDVTDATRSRSPCVPALVELRVSPASQQMRASRIRCDEGGSQDRNLVATVPVAVGDRRSTGHPAAVASRAVRIP
jgi:hypothetical protein